MATLPHRLYRARQVRELDRLAMEEFAIAGAVLMQRAGSAAFEALLQQWGDARHLAVVCGTGNNGGDGFVIARLAHQAGLGVEVFVVGDPAAVRGDAGQALEALIEAGVRPQTVATKALAFNADLIVDAMLGTGLDRAVGGLHRDTIEAINAADVPVLAVDIPSGLHCDTGQPLGVAVIAAMTVTFVGLKQGLFTGEGPAHAGAVRFSDLGVSQSAYERVEPSALRLSALALEQRLGRRARSAHKGRYGHVLVIGGDYGMGGAARLAGEAAARAGAGLVSVATRPEHAYALAAARPELMSHPVRDAAELRPLLRRANAVAIGPGLGRSPWARTLFAAAYDTQLPLIIDADGLNLLAAEPQRRERCLITPHPGEAARLLGLESGAEIQADRFKAVAALRERYAEVAVLKGAGTLVCSGAGPIGLADVGNPGMASGGMGDLLTGVIAGLLAQGLDLTTAAQLGVCLHGQAGDAAAEEGERGMLACDLLPFIRRLANPSLRR